MRQPACLEVFRAVYQACIFCCVEEGMEPSYLCLWLLGFLRNNGRNTARYFPFLRRVTLATATFICKLWGLEKNMKSQKGPLSAPLLPPSLACLPLLTSCPPNPPSSGKCNAEQRASYVSFGLMQRVSRCRCTPPQKNQEPSVYILVTDTSPDQQ